MENFRRLVDLLKIVADGFTRDIGDDVCDFFFFVLWSRESDALHFHFYFHFQVFVVIEGFVCISSVSVYIRYMGYLMLALPSTREYVADGNDNANFQDYGLPFRCVSLIFIGLLNVSLPCLMCWIGSVVWFEFFFSRGGSWYLMENVIDWSFKVV